MCLIERLVVVANQNGHALHVVMDEGWTARPVVVCPFIPPDTRFHSSGLGPSEANKCF